MFKHKLSEDWLLIHQITFHLELFIGSSWSDCHCSSCSPLFDTALNCIWWLSLKKIWGWNTLVLEPACHIFPCYVIFVLSWLSDNAGRTRDILLLDNPLFWRMFFLHLYGVILSHYDHFDSLFILCLTPLWECCSTVLSPKHFSHLVAPLVLISCKLLVSSKLTNILEATLPHRFHDHILCALCKMFCALCVSSPL